MTASEQPPSDSREFHLKFALVLKNTMYAIGILAWDNSGKPPILWGLTNCTPDQLRKLRSPVKKK